MVKELWRIPDEPLTKEERKLEPKGTIFKIGGEKARALVEEVKMIVSRDFNAHLDQFHFFRYNPELDEGRGGIEGSSAYLSTWVNQALSGEAHLPNHRAGRILDSKGCLKEGSCSDYGLVLYSSKGPNQGEANSLANQAKRLGYGLPIIIDPRALSLKPGRYEFQLSEDPEGITWGEEARGELEVFESGSRLERFEFIGNSGLHRIFRAGAGFWFADHDTLWSSNHKHRIGWFCKPS